MQLPNSFFYQSRIIIRQFSGSCQAVLWQMYNRHMICHLLRSFWDWKTFQSYFHLIAKYDAIKVICWLIMVEYSIRVKILLNYNTIFTDLEGKITHNFSTKFGYSSHSAMKRVKIFINQRPAPLIAWYGQFGYGVSSTMVENYLVFWPKINLHK